MKNNVFSLKNKNRCKGAAIELAISLLIITFSLSFLILTTSYLAHIRQVKAEKKLENQVFFEQMGEDFINGVKTGTGTSWTNNYPEHDITVNQLKLSVREKGEEEILFEAELEDNGDGTYNIIKWKKN